MAGLAVLAVILVFTAISLTSDVSDYKPEEVVIENIKPVGDVYIAGVSEPEEAAPATTMTADAGEAAAPKSGEQVYNASCMGCHTAGVAGAPKLGDKAAWAPRIAAGMDSLLANATNGIKAMPPKGTCMSCSSDELQAAVEYIVSNSQ
ncbi:MAG: cytochrome c5 family protein [Gammaproteobacteria bacterium]|nr:cytochrome c5 family protein [Gammaproteobacteria bacterium]